MEFRNRAPRPLSPDVPFPNFGNAIEASSRPTASLVPKWQMAILRRLQHAVCLRDVYPDNKRYSSACLMQQRGITNSTRTSTKPTHCFHFPPRFTSSITWSPYFRREMVDILDRLRSVAVHGGDQDPTRLDVSSTTPIQSVCGEVIHLLERLHVELPLLRVKY